MTLNLWTETVSALPGPLNKDAGQLLLKTLAFLDGEHAKISVSLGWDEAALFGVHACSAPRPRLEGWGAGHDTRLVGSKPRRPRNRRWPCFGLVR